MHIPTFLFRFNKAPHLRIEIIGKSGITFTLSSMYLREYLAVFSGSFDDNSHYIRLLNLLLLGLSSLLTLFE